jgi:hypothetical protein
MQRKTLTINNLTFDLVIHSIDGEVSEVYASHNGMEIAFAYDLESIDDKLTEFVSNWS